MVCNRCNTWFDLASNWSSIVKVNEYSRIACWIIKIKKIAQNKKWVLQIWVKWFWKEYIAIRTEQIN